MGFKSHVLIHKKEHPNEDHGLRFRRDDLEDKKDGVEVLTDPMADKVPYYLVDNSMRHGGHVTRIKMSAKQVGDSMLIVYEDDGVGISAEERETLVRERFRQKHRLRAVPHQGDTCNHWNHHRGERPGWKRGTLRDACATRCLAAY